MLSSATVTRWNGWALLVSGPIGLVVALLTGVLYPRHRATAQQVLSVPWILGACLYLAAFLLLTLGLPALYRHWATSAGGLGVAGFVLTALGVVVGGVAVGLIQLTLIPQAQADPHAFPIGSQPDQAATLLFVTIPVLLLASGAIIVGGAGLQSRLSPREAAALLLGSGIIALLSLVVPAGIENVLDPLWNGLYFLALGWCGLAVVVSRTFGGDAGRLSSCATPLPPKRCASRGGSPHRDA